ncbi:MAG: hypothetical protein ACRDDX_03880 [Cellulosilyticaceae bacterium]
MKKFKDIIKNNKKYVVAASVVALSFGAVGVMPTLATKNPVAYKLATVLGIEKDLDEYATVVNQMITSKDGVSVGIGEVAYDQANHKLRIVTYITSPEKVEEGKHWSTFTRVNINGEELNQGATFETKQIDEHTIALVENHNIKEKLEGKLDINLFIPQVEVNDNIYYNTDWKFAFTADSSALIADTAVMSIDKEIVVNEQEEEITLVKYVSNDFEQSIYFKTDNLLMHTALEIRGQDDLGNEVVFMEAGGNMGQGGALRIEGTPIAKEAKSLTLQLYALALPEQSGPIEGDYEKVGETFTITLQ